MTAQNITLPREVVEQLVKELSDAQTSLETISMMAGKAVYGNHPLDTYLRHHDQVRGYAASRAGCATEALALGRAALATEQPKRPINCGTGHCSCIECLFEPAQAPLTDEQMLAVLLRIDALTIRLTPGFRAFARAIEQAHGIGAKP